MWFIAQVQYLEIPYAMKNKTFTQVFLLFPYKLLCSFLLSYTKVFSFSLRREGRGLFAKNSFVGESSPKSNTRFWGDDVIKFQQIASFSKVIALKGRVAIFAVLLALGVGGNAWGQSAAVYSFSTSLSATLDAMTSSTQLVAEKLDDGVSTLTNIGFTFNIHPTDTLYVYDGPSIASPLLGAYNSGTNPNGFFVQASFQNNPSGCLTLRFRSNGSNEGTGWDANVACGNPQQPFFPHIQAFINGVGANALNPIDTGYVDVCFGDSILFVSTANFPYASEVTNTGYSQNANNCSYQWTIGGIGQFVVQN